jgi:hypothetical protein
MPVKAVGILPLDATDLSAFGAAAAVACAAAAGSRLQGCFARLGAMVAARLLGALQAM